MIDDSKLRELIEAAAIHGVEIVLASEEEHRGCEGLHLGSPNEQQIISGVAEAKRLRLRTVFVWFKQRE